MACAVFLLLASSVQAATVSVFLLGGQSNMDGRGDEAGLPVELQNPQADVLFYHGSALTTLRPGSGTDFGPEVSFGRSVADTFPSEMFCLIKHAQGGTDLHSDWDPTSGSVYTAFRNTVTAGLAALTSSGHTYEVVGMLWTQGERDAKDDRTTAQYQADLNEFIADVRSRYGPELPFFLSRLSSGQTSISSSRLGEIRAAQENVAAADARAWLINTDDIGVEADNLHFNAAGQIALGERFSAAYVAHRASGPLETLAYYSFDSDFSDASANTNHLSVAEGTPTITTTAGEFRYGGAALDLDSSTSSEEYLDLASAIAFGSNTPWAVSFWARRRPGTGEASGMIIGDPRNNADFIWVPDNPAQVRGLRFRNSAGNSYDYGTFPDDNAFHHWVVVADGAGNITAYRDSVSLGSRSADTAFDITSVGQAFSTLKQSMDGQIDELRIHSGTLDATAVSNLYHYNTTTAPPPPAVPRLLAYYSFDSDFSDASSNTNHLSVAEGTPTITTTAGEFRYGGAALDLDSSTSSEEYLDLATAITFSNNTPWSVSFWGRRRPGTGEASGMIVGDPGNKTDFIWTPDNPTQVRGLRFRNSHDISYNYGTFIDDNAFHHWVVVADGAGSVNAYRDNVSLGSKSANTAFNITSVGHAFNASKQSMDGQIDELRIYSIALDAGDVANLYYYNSTRSRATLVIVE